MRSSFTTSAPASHPATPLGEVASRYDAGAEHYDRRGGRARAHSQLRLAAVDAPALAITRGVDRVLELGVGTGRLLSQAGGTLRLGVDVSRGMLGRAATKGLAVAAADAHRLPLADASFDAIIAGNGVFCHLDYERALAECARVLRPGGQLAVHQYSRRTWSVRGAVGETLGLGHPSELATPARRHGFNVVSVERWRSVRFRPYVVAIPPWLDLPLWSHCTLVFRRR